MAWAAIRAIMEFMQWLLIGLLLAGPPFWEKKPVREWSDEDLHEMLHDSPWARPAVDAESAFGGVQTYIASARLIQEAEAEVERRAKLKAKPPKPSDVELPEEVDDYREFLKENGGKSLVLAVYYPDTKPLANAAEAQYMEEHSIMKVGRKKYKMEGHFPPTRRDPYLRMLFPKPFSPSDKRVVFELYLPGADSPFRDVQYILKEMVRDGKPEL
jgi:hypothetical protein